MDEIKIIDIISKNLKYKGKSIKTIGDDCGVYKLNNNHLLITTDSMFKSTHLPDIITPFQMGIRIATANLSDISAMCGKPLFMVISLGLDSKAGLDSKFIDEFSKGLNYMAEKYDCPILGGDTNKSKELTLSGTCVGITDNPIYRGGCVGDDIFITNNIGRPYCALKLIEMRNKGIISKDEFNKLVVEYEEIIKKLCEPMPMVYEGLVLNKHVNSACDISDGIGKDILTVGNFEIYSKKLMKLLPKDVIDFCDRFNLDYLDVALNSGEEFELLISSKKDIKEIVEENTKSTCVKVGKVIDTGKYIDGIEYNLKNKGYIHKW